MKYEIISAVAERTKQSKKKNEKIRLKIFSSSSSSTRMYIIYNRNKERNISIDELLSVSLFLYSWYVKSENDISESKARSTCLCFRAYAFEWYSSEFICSFRIQEVWPHIYVQIQMIGLIRHSTSSHTHTHPQIIYDSSLYIYIFDFQLTRDDEKVI